MARTFRTLAPNGGEGRVRGPLDQVATNSEELKVVVAAPPPSGEGYGSSRPIGDVVGASAERTRAASQPKELDFSYGRTASRAPLTPTLPSPRGEGYSSHRPLRVVALVALALSLAGCHTDMWRQPKHEPLEASEGLFADGAASRPLVPGTVSRGNVRLDDAYYTGRENGKWVDAIPGGLADSPELRKELLARGQERFNVYCSPCHGQLGDGKGMISQRGFILRRPVGNYHTDRLRKMPLGHFYDVITNGYGAMYSYASRVEPQDRWAIVAYIRALQLSQHAPSADKGQAKP